MAIAAALGVAPKKSKCGTSRSSAASGGAMVVSAARHIRYVRPARGTTSPLPNRPIVTIWQSQRALAEAAPKMT